MYPACEVANLGEHRRQLAGLTDLVVVVVVFVVVVDVVVVVVPAHESLQPDPASLGVDQRRARLSLIKSCYNIINFSILLNFANILKYDI